MLAGAPPPRLRAVAVLFCDVIDSTALTDPLDPEDRAAFYSEFRRVVRAATLQHATRRLSFSGDGARIVFGYPDAGEDMAESAVECGLALTTAIREVGGPLRGMMNLRVGVAFGTVVLGDAVEDTADSDESVVGMVPALAVRLAGEAASGGVLIDHTTYRLVGGFFDCEELEPRPLKGFEGLIRCWRVSGRTAITSRYEARRATQESALVGRENWRNDLATAWQAARAGLGSVVAIVGEPGVGKSTLALSLKDLVTAEAGQCLTFDCIPRRQNVPLAPFRALVRRLAGVESVNDQMPVPARIEAWLARHLPADRVAVACAYLVPVLAATETAQPSQESPELIRARTTDLIVELLQAVAARTPMLLLLEDLQWADPTTLFLLGKLVANLGEHPILLLATARSGTSLDLPSSVVRELAPLSPEEARELVRLRARGKVLSPEAFDWVLRIGDGVPFCLEECTRAALESVAQRGAGVDMSPAPIPKTLEHLIQARLYGRPSLRDISVGAAVLGREFRLVLLEQLSGQPPAATYDAVARLIDDGIFCPVEAHRPDRIRFRHALIQEAIYATLLRSERERLHSAVADLLRAGPAGAPESAPDVLAYHLGQAGRHEDAARHLLIAANETLAGAAYEEAIAQCRAGLKHCDQIRDAAVARPLKRDLLIRLGMGLTATQGYAAPEVASAYVEARALCDDEADPVALYPIFRGLSTFHLVRGELQVAHELSARGVALAEASGRPEFRIDALSVHAYATLYAGTLAETDDVLARCLALYEAEDGRRLRYPVPQDAATAAYALLPTVAWLRGDGGRCERAIQDGLAHVDSLGRAFDKALLYAWIAGTRFTQRRNDDAQDFAEQAAAISERYGYRDWLDTGQAMTGLALAVRDCSAHGLQQAGMAMASLGARGVGLNASYYLWGLARAHARGADGASAAMMIALARARAEASGDVRMNAELLILQAELASEDSEATQHLLSALGLAEQQGDQATAMRAALALVARNPASFTSAFRASAQDWQAALDGGEVPGDRAWMQTCLAQARPLLAALASIPAKAAAPEPLRH